MNKHIHIFPLLAITITLSTNLLAKSPTSDADINLLPPYCKAKYGKTSSADADNWKRRFGRGNWVHMHHYCSGLNKMNKAIQSFDVAERNNILESAIKSFDYVQTRWPSTFVLQPEVCLKKGEAFMKLNQVGSALGQFTQATKLNPKYTPAYAELSDYYKDQGEKEKAIQILEQGLTHKPNSKMLKRRLEELKNPN